MNTFLILTYLFFIGSVFGWILELLYRNVTRHHEKLVNPGFCTGPYLPIYGFGLCTLYLLADLERLHIIANPVLNKALLLILMTVCMTVIEYIAGILCLKVFKVRLWDYSEMRGNLQGIICPLYSIMWGVLSAIYYFAVHPLMLSAIDWLSENLAFSFVIGMFFGIFIIDVVHSADLIVRLKKFAEDNHMVIRYEELKESIRQAHIASASRYHFFRPFKTDIPLSDHIRELQKSIEKRFPKRPGK